MTSRYQDVYRAWKSDPSGFWAEAAKEISWFTPWDKPFDETQGVYGRWFPGATTNVAYNCLDRHVDAGRAGQPALVHESPITGSRTALTYAELTARVAAFAAVLADHGVEKGDRVLVYMPMIPEAVVAMLATARLGAVHSVVFGGFAARELATRIDDAEPKLIVSASCGIEPGRIIAYQPLVDEAVTMAKHKPVANLVFQRPQRVADLRDGRDFDAGVLLEKALSEGRRAACTPIAATDPHYILYTSGTTGVPKGVVRDAAGMVALKWTMAAVYGVRPGEAIFTASDIGWVVGHSYIVYGPLLHGATTVLYEGKPVGTPDAGQFWRVIEENRVSVLFTAPTALRAIKKEDPEGTFLASRKLASLRALFLAGERADPDTSEWATGLLGVPVIDNWWQTETGWPIAANPLGLGLVHARYGSAGVPMPGHQLEVVDDDCNPLPHGVLGNLVIRLPLPPGCLPTLWQKDERFRSDYLSDFPGYYKTSDAGYIDGEGCVFIMGRTDDIINVAGHRLSTGGMEEVLAGHPAVAECAVVGISDALKGQQPLGLVVLKSGVTRATQEIEAELVARVREIIGPVAAFRLAITVARLPKTRSGKILRGAIRQLADGEPVRVPATVDDPTVFGEIEDILYARGVMERLAAVLEQGRSLYTATYGRWQRNPSGFWAEAAKEISWFTPWDKPFDETQGVYGRWFPGATTNVAYNCLDRHVDAGRAGQPALVHESPITGSRTALTYAELTARVAAFAAVLADHGVEKGDRVLVYMPMIPEAVVAMLATARLGAVHSVVFGGFAARELATRIDDAEPKLIVSASCGIEPGRIIAYQPLVDEAVTMAKHKPVANLVFQRPQRVADLRDGRDFDAGVLLEKALSEGRRAACTPIAATDPHYILYTSGTTGVPKGVVRDAAGMVALKWTMAAVYGVRPGEAIFTASDIGWVVGHSYIVYGPLLHGATTVLYEGKPVGTPDAGQFWRVIEENRVSVLFTAPTALRAIKKEDPEGTFLASRKLASLRALFLAGERADPDTSEWATGLLGVPVIDNWWQTETGWPIAANPLGLGLVHARYGSAGVPMPGHQLEVVDDDCNPLPHGVLGNLVIRLPLPPGCLPTLWQKDERFRSDYLSDFPGYYKTSDAGYIDGEGCVFIMGRTDDIINVAGHRLSTGGMEEVLAGHPAVAECAVVGISDALKGQQPLGLVVLKSGVTRATQEIEAELVARVREIIGPVAAFRLAITVARLPKTRSGKILRGAIRQLADGEPLRIPATIDDASVLGEIEDSLQARGILDRLAAPVAEA